MSTLQEWAARNGEVIPGLERTAGMGRDLGKSFEAHIQRGLEVALVCAQREGRLGPLPEWTQPKFRWGRKKGRSQWTPCGKGWPDLNLYLEDARLVTVDCKAVDMGAKKHANRWSLDKKLRRDMHGHQIATLDDLSARGHKAGVLLGRWQDGRWSLYVVPVSVDFARPSIPWVELEPYRVPQGAQWWEVLL